jgi:hypothetical protein
MPSEYTHARGAAANWCNGVVDAPKNGVRQSRCNADATETFVACTQRIERGLQQALQTRHSFLLRRLKTNLACHKVFQIVL